MAYEAVPQLAGGLTRYFGYYNEERLHQSLDYRTPEVLPGGGGGDEAEISARAAARRPPAAAAEQPPGAAGGQELPGQRRWLFGVRTSHLERKRTAARAAVVVRHGLPAPHALGEEVTPPRAGRG